MARLDKKSTGSATLALLLSSGKNLRQFVEGECVRHCSWQLWIVAKQTDPKLGATLNSVDNDRWFDFGWCPYLIDGNFPNPIVLESKTSPGQPSYGHLPSLLISRCEAFRPAVAHALDEPVCVRLSNHGAKPESR